MSFGKRVYEVVNKHIMDEFASAYAFLTMSTVLFEMGLKGCAKWTEIQAKKRAERAMVVYHHMQMRNGKIRLLPIPITKQEWRAPLHIFEEMLRLEQRLAASITAIYEFSVGDKDFQTQGLLTWFIQEQLKNEATAEELLGKLRKIQSTDLGVFMFDAEMAHRAEIEGVEHHAA
jgi:ferritin